jgi:hypothetical protein
MQDGYSLVRTVNTALHCALEMQATALLSFNKNEDIVTRVVPPMHIYAVYTRIYAYMRICGVH